MFTTHHKPGKARKPAKSERNAKIAHLDEPRLLRSLAEGEIGAAAELVHRVAADGWHLALIVQQRAEPATDLTLRAVSRVLSIAFDGQLPPDTTFRAAALRAVRDDALEGRLSVGDGTDLRGDDTVACFAQLAEPSRSALLLADIVLLPDEQLGHPLHLPADDARALADRAVAALRRRLTRRVAASLNETELHDALVGATDHIRASLPPPPDGLDEMVLAAWARNRTTHELPVAGALANPTSLADRIAATGPAARRVVAAAAAAVLVAGVAALGAASGPHHTAPAGTAVAAPVTAPPPTRSSSSATAAASAPSSTSAAPATSAPAPPDDAALAASLLQRLSSEATEASVPQTTASASGATPTTADNTVLPSNVGPATPANPATPAPAPTTTAPAPTTTPPTTTAPAPTTTNPLQPVVNLVNKVLGPLAP